VINPSLKKNFHLRVRKLDVHHDKDTNVTTVSFDLPGSRKEGVKVDVYNDVLTLSEESLSLGACLGA
jgi:HSP20 family molecular chaperone IbpA